MEKLPVSKKVKGSSWTSDQYKAIAYYAKRNNLRMALCTFPIAEFVNERGEHYSKNIMEILVDYRTNKAEEDREKRRKKREDNDS